MFKQPRVPEYRENEGAPKHLRALTLFLKDFCQDVWTHCKNNTGSKETIVIDYPVTSVNKMTGDVVLNADDVGAADYETGEWSPTLIGESTAGKLTYGSVTNGLFWRFGRLVFIRAYIAVSGIATAPAGNLALAGLPFAAVQASIPYPAATNQWGPCVFQFSPGGLGNSATRIRTESGNINASVLTTTNYAFFGVYHMAG